MNVPALPFQRLMWKYMGEDPEHRSTHDIARMTGLNQFGIWKILNGQTERVRFDTADKILTGFDMNELWHTDPLLSSYYENDKIRYLGGGLSV